MDKNDGNYSAKSLDENLEYNNTDVRSCGDNHSSVTTPRNSFPLHDINSKNVREYLSSIENAQKKWLENAKSWPVNDEVQNAQVQWLQELSASGSKFLCTSTPQPKKKAPQYTLPFSPPRSSADIDPRRGVCVYYKPGIKKNEIREYVNEKGYSVKVARVEEPVTAPVKKPFQEEQKKLVQNDRIKPNTSPLFPGADSKTARKSPKKRHITVRKKLERLKPPATGADDDKQKSSSSSDIKPDERREAAREYILKKRAERERELEEERKQEARALEEKKARLERLRETQQRLIKNAMKKQPQVTADGVDNLEENAEKSSILLDSHDFEHLWNVPYGDSQPEIRPFQSSPTRRESFTKRHSSPRKSINDSLTNIQSNISSEMKPLENAAMNLEPPIVELLLNNDTSSSKKLALFETLEEPSLSKRPTSPAHSHSDQISNQQLLVSPNKPHSNSTKSSPVSLKKDIIHSSRHSITMPTKSSISLTKGHEKQQDHISRSCSDNSLSSSCKESEKKAEQYIRYPKCPQYTSLSEISPTWAGMARPYNMLMAVANKRAALEQLKRDSLKKEAKDNKKKNDKHKPDLTNEKLPHKNKELALKETKHIKVSEKGVQCSSIGTSNYRSPKPCSSSDQLVSSSINSLDVNFTRNEGLRKPDIALTQPMSNDSYMYRPSEVFLAQEETAAHITAENESVFECLYPVNIAPKNIKSSEIPSDKVPPCGFDSKSGVPPNGKGRPGTAIIKDCSHNLLVDPLNIPLDFSLISRKSEVGLNETKNNDCEADGQNNTFAETSTDNFLNFPKSFIDFTMNNSAVINDGGGKHLLVEPVKTVSNQQTLVEEVKENSRDSRIESEIKKLDSFNESIASVMEKNKTVLSHNDLNLKSSCEEYSILENTLTASLENSTANNEVLEISQEPTIIPGSHSSSSFDLPSDDISGTSIAKFSLNMFSELLKDEDLRNTHQTALFKMKENTISEKTKAEIAFLELEKKKLKQAGNEEGIRNIRKKIRGLIIKLENDLEELHRERRLERNSYRKRRQRLVDKINTIKMQLKAQSDMQNKVAKDVSVLSNSGVELKKTHVNDRRGSDMRAFLEKKKKELEHREILLAERLAELENISSWKQRLEDGEKRIQELEARLKISSAQDTKKERRCEGLVERGTSPFRLTSDESQAERQKGEGSYSDTFDQASSSSTHDRLEGKDARKMMAIKVPLSPRLTLKRRHSSGSDESLLLSQTETQSEASDMEVRVLALQQQLKQRKAKLESLHREYKKSQRERLIAKEQSLLSQIQAYDLYIDQVSKELEKEKEVSTVKIVKPLIKQPKLVSERRKSDTWLIQDKKEKDPTKPSVESSFNINSTGNFLAGPSKGADDFNFSEKKNYNLDTKGLESLSLKSKLSLKNSFSDGNLLEGAVEPLDAPKVSHSSTESCESDTEKNRVATAESDSKSSIKQHSSEQNRANTLGEDSFSDKDSPLSQIATSTNVSIKEINSTVHSRVVQENELKSVETDSVPQEKYSDHEESEENTSTQESIVSKIGENLAFSKNEVALESVESNKSSLDIGNINESVAEEIDGSVKTTSICSEPMSELDISKNKSDEVVQGEDKFIVESANVNINQLTENKTDSESKSVVEELISKNQSLDEEIITTHSSSDRSSKSIDVNNRNEKNKDSTSTPSHTDDSKQKKSEYSSKQNEEVGDLNENSKTFGNLSSNGEMENNEMSIEESVREVTYLEISDHAISAYEPESEDGMKEVSEQSIAEMKAQTELSGSHEVQEKRITSPEEHFIIASSSQNIHEEKSTTVHSLSEVEEHLSKTSVDDISDGSFPLPTTKELNVDKFIKQNISGFLSPNNSKEESEIRETVLSHASSVVEELSKKESTASEVIESIAAEIPESESTEYLKVFSDAHDEGKINLESEHAGETSEPLDSRDNTQIQSDSQEPIEEIVNDLKPVDITEECEEDVSGISEADKSFSVNLEEEYLKSPLDESNVDDSIDENSHHLISLKQKSKHYSHDEEYESISDGSDSFLDERLSEEDVYNHKTSLLQPQQLWTQENDLKRPGAPLIEALQREGGSALDVVWRDIAETEVKEATDLVISTFFKRKQEETIKEEHLQVKEVGDNDEEEWRREKLSQEQAEAEAEILRLQQLRIDKEIEELEEEEARQYYYVRAIPDKPPPPYTPRKSSLVTNVVEAAGEIWSGQTSVPSSFMPGSHLREFIWDLAAELVRRVNPPPPPLRPPWVRNKRRRPRKPLRTKEQLLEEVEKEAKIYLGVEEREVRENLIIRWSRKRRDHVDEILVRESQEEEWEWTDFTEEENIIKNRIAETLIQETINTATAAIAQAFERKFNAK